MGSLWESKTNRQILIGISLTLVLVMVGIAVEVAFNHSVFEYIALGVGKLFGDTTLATYRNVKTDTPIRIQEATLKTAIEADKAGIVMPAGPTTWTPPPQGGSQ